jgi:formylglycine-generating enzyme
MRGPAAIDRRDTAFDGMLRIPGGTFRMGSDKHYPEEAPVHSVTVDEFYIDRYRPAVRHAEPINTSTSHVGFRCVKRVSRTRETFR